MCIPGALTAVAGGGAAAAGTSVLTNVLGMAFSALGKIQSARQQQAQFKYQAQIARNNQIIANQSADDELARGRVEEQQKRLQASRLKGKQRTTLAANGVVIDEGSALDILEDTAALGEFDTLVIRSNAERRATALRNQAGGFGVQAQMFSTAGSNAMSDGFLGAAGSLVTGASQVANKWYALNKVGLA